MGSSTSKWRGSPVTGLSPFRRVHERAVHIALHFALDDHVAFIAVLPALAHADLDFYLAVLEIHLERHYREPLFEHARAELHDFGLVHEQLARAFRLVV